MSYATLKVKIEKLIELAKKGKNALSYTRVRDLLFAPNKLSYGYIFQNSPITSEELKKMEIDFSVANKSVTNFFRNCENLVTAPVINFCNATSAQYLFGDCANLETVELLNISSSTSNLNNFSGCVKLKNIKFAQSCIKANISFADSPLLTDESIQSIIDGLATVTNDTKITFHTDTVAKITEAQQIQITNKNWYVG